MCREQFLQTLGNARVTEPVIIGHRGLQMNTSPDELVRENTLMSFQQAHHAGAAWVEFDVQVTSDMVPVLWHDDELLTLNASGDVVSHTIGELTLDNFRMLASGRPAVYQGVDCQLARKFKGQDRAFLWPHNNGGEPCTLQEVLENAPTALGFDIEIKFDSRRVSTEEERVYHLSNTFRVISEFAKDRMIFFTSFDPSACIQMREMQNHWPVLMLTCMGENEPDPRQRSLKAAVEVAVQNNLDGIVADNTQMFNEISQIDILRSSGMCLLTYGNGNVKPEMIVQQHAVGVKALCTDSIVVCTTTLTTLKLLQRDPSWLRETLLPASLPIASQPLPIPA